MDSKKVTGIILAGGRSSRMGIEKGMVNFQGQPLIQYSIDVLKNYCSRIIISTNSNAYYSLGYPVQNDIVHEAGPMGGIYSSLLHSKTDYNLILSCDTPFVTSFLLRKILENSEGYQVVIPLSRQGFPEPLIGFYHKNNTTGMLGFINNRNLKLTDYIETTIYKAIPVYQDPTLFDPYLFLNFNSLGDIKAFQKKNNKDGIPPGRE